MISAKGTTETFGSFTIEIESTIYYSCINKMDSTYLHFAIAREYNLTRKPVIDRFVKTYDGEIKYVFSQDYILEVYGQGYRIGLASDRHHTQCQKK